MADIEELRRRYRRLLWAYPNWYRHERGQEILTTLLDAAPPARRRPRRREVLDLLWHGALCRLRPPPGIASRVVATTAALFAAAAGLAVASGALFAALAPAPSEQQAIAIAEVAMAAPPHNVPGPTVRCFDYCPSQAGVNSADQVVVFDDPPWRNRGVDHTEVAYRNQPPDAVEAARSRLAAAGWTIDDRQDAPGSTRSGPQGWQSTGFTAYRGHLALHVDRSTYPPLMLILEPRLPTSFPLNARSIAGAIAGLMSGWLVTTWVQHRYRRHSPNLSGLIRLLSIPPLLPIGFALSLPSVVVLWSLLTEAELPELSDIAVLVYILYGLIGLRGAAIIALGLGLSAMLAVLIATLPMRGRPSERHSSVA